MGATRGQGPIRFGEDFELDVRSFQLRRGERALKLERIPMEILLLLIERAGHLVSRDEIVERVWGKNVFLDTDNSINSAIRKIRQVLRDDSERPKYLQTVVGRGYIFIASQVRQDSARVAGVVDDPITDTSLIGRRLGDYRILQLIGAGGMGVVYVAEDLKLGRQVAIKLLPAELVNHPGALERMQREARIASTLDHPNICAIYQLAESENQPFIVMPLLRGRTLREWIESQGNAPAARCVREIMSVAIQICEGLEVAHEKGIIHRDIKPANIFLTSSGEVKILDFGVAKILNAAESPEPLPGASEQSTRPNPIVTEPSTGTPAYLSPEQIKGDPLDERTDLFSFGSVLYEMCTGQRAFQGEDTSTIQAAIVSTQPASIQTRKPDLPGKLQEIVSKALEKDRERRYRTASEMSVELHALSAAFDAPTDSTGKSSPLKSGAGIFTSKKFLAGVTGVAVLVGALFWAFNRTDRQPFREFTVTQITNSGRAEQAAIAPDGKYVLHVHDENGMRSLRLRNIATGSDTEILAAQNTRFKSLAFSPDGNYVYFRQLVNSVGSEWDVFRMPVLGGKPEKVSRDVDSDIIFSPDATHISYVRANDPEEGTYRVLTANLDGSKENVLVAEKIKGFGNDAYPPFGAWSPDGRQIAYTFAKMADEPGVVRVLHVGSRQISVLQHFPDLLTFDIRWPTRNWLLLVNSARGVESTPSQISALSLADRKLHTITRDTNSYSSLSVSADGKTAAAVQTKTLAFLDLFDVDLHAMTARTNGLAGKLDNINSFDWIDNDHLLVSNGAKIARLDAATGKAVEVLSDASSAIVGLAQCSTGYILINREFRTGNSISEIWRANQDGSNLTKLSDGQYDMSPACSPDGKWAFYLDGMQRLRRAPVEGGASEAVAAAIPNLDRVLGTFGFSPDGSSMVALVDVVDHSANRVVARLAVFDLKASSQSPPRLIVPDPRISAGSLHSGGVRFSPDGKSLIYAIKAQGVGNLWMQSFDGSPGHAITSYATDVISHFRFSPNGKTLAIKRTHSISDIVVIHDGTS